MWLRSREACRELWKVYALSRNRVNVSVSGRPVVIPRLENKALRLSIQRKYIRDESDKAAFKSISS